MDRIEIEARRHRDGNFGEDAAAEFDLDKVINPELSIAEDCCSIGSSYGTVRYGNIYNNLAKIYGFDVEAPWKKLSENKS